MDFYKVNFPKVRKMRSSFFYTEKKSEIHVEVIVIIMTINKINCYSIYQKKTKRFKRLEYK